MNQQKILISIVIVNFNYGIFLEQTILSIINQNFSDYELIIIDGNSTDNSVDIIKKYQDKIDYWISEPDKGQSDAFNKGFAKAKGEFGFWVNADDILMPYSLLYIAHYIKKYPKYNWFAGNTIFFNERNKIINCRKGPGWKTFLIKRGPIYVYGPSSIFRLKLLKEVGGFDINLFYTMDTDLWMRFVNRGEKFKRIKEYIWGFRLHEESKTSHSFTSAIHPKMEKEAILISRRNNYPFLKYKLFLQRMYKLLCGSHIASIIETRKYTGTDINSFKIK